MSILTSPVVNLFAQGLTRCYPFSQIGSPLVIFAHGNLCLTLPLIYSCVIRVLETEGKQIILSVNDTLLC